MRKRPSLKKRTNNVKVVCRLYAHFLRYSRSPHLQQDTRLPYAFDAGYVLLLDAARRAGCAIPIEHPDPAIVRAGARALGVPSVDEWLALDLLRWVDFDRYAKLRPAPCSLRRATLWAKRIHLRYVLRLRSGRRGTPLHPAN